MRAILPAALILTLSIQANADDWPQFRGPGGQGISPEKDLPLKWNASTGENILWKAPLIGEGHASPVVSGDRLFITTVRWPDDTKDPKVMPEHHVLCYSTKDGTLLWNTSIKPGRWLRKDFRSGPGGGYASPTPATDGKNVFVVFGSSVIAALDFQGKVAWRNEIEPHTFDVTVGTSPVLYGETVIMLCAMSRKEHSKLVAYAKNDGSTRWETRMPTTGFAHSTPLLINAGGKDQLITVASGMGRTPDAIQSFDPANGKRLWWGPGAGDAASPSFGAGIVYADSGRGSEGIAIDPTGSGDVGNSHVKWTTRRVKGAIGSPILVGETVYRLLGSGAIVAWNAKDGTETERIRLDRPGSTWASPIATADGRLYVVSGGKSIVLTTVPKLEILAENDLGDPNHATPAVSGGRLFVAGLKHLYAIGRK